MRLILCKIVVEPRHKRANWKKIKLFGAILATILAPIKHKASTFFLIAVSKLQIYYLLSYPKKHK